MKNFKYILVGAMIALSAPSFAQGDANDITTQVVNIVKNTADPKAKVKAVDALAKPYKKDAKMLAKIGRACMNAQDYETAMKYADLAIKANKNCADGYVLKGDIFVLQDNGGEASSWYEQAIYFDPNDPNGYRRYAVTNSKTSPTAAKEKLEELRVKCPDYPVDIVAAEMMMNIGKTDEAIEYYKKADRSKMKEEQLVDFAIALLSKQDLQGCLDIASYGHNKAPRYGAFNRLMLYTQTDLKKFDEATAAGDLLFNNSDDVDFKPLDYAYYARALEGAKQYDKAVEQYEKYQALEGISEDEKNQLFKSISDCYIKASQYDKAYDYLKKYEAAVGSSNAVDMMFANVYAKQMQDDNSTAEQKAAAYQKVDAIYAKIAEQTPDNAIYITNERAKLAFQTGADQMEGLKNAGPHYVTLASLIEAKAEKSTAEVKVLKTTYNYLIAYYAQVKDDMAGAKAVAEKLIVIEPDNSNAKIVLGIK